MTEVTRILSRIESGDSTAAEELLPLVYDELCRLAAARMAREKPGQTLQATALVHEAKHWNSRGHFFVAAAEAMRRVLVEKARRKQRLRHGGQFHRLNLERLDVAAKQDSEQLLALDVALESRAAEQPKAAEVVKLRYFAGLTIPQAASALGVSGRTANRHWAFAKAWLFQQLHVET